MKLILRNDLCRPSRIISLYSLQLSVPGKKLPTLHERYRMGMDLTDRVPVIIRQATDAVLYVKLMLTDNRCARHPEQFVIVEEAPGNRILYCQHRNDGRIILDTLEYLLEGIATDKLQLLSLEILVCGNVMETAQLSLNGYSLHILNYTKNGPTPKIGRDRFVIVY